MHSWADIDTELNSRHMNLRWISEAVRTEGFNIDSLSKCQLVSKFRLMTLLHDAKLHPHAILICGAWYGQLATMLHDNNLGVSYTGVDLDRSTQVLAERLNRYIPYDHVIEDMYDFDYYGHDIVINTSCEHIPHLRKWLDLLPKGTTVALQSNNYYEIEDHINCCDDIDEFIEKANLSEIIVYDELPMPMYTRFTLIGRT